MNRPAIKRILLATDFGSGPYVGQMRARLHDLLPETPTLDLIHDLPPFRPDLAAYLLPALRRDLPRHTLYLCVVDPGVGGDRAGLLVEADGDCFIGPDNGLFALIVRRARVPRLWRIGWRSERMSASFHGRDWFAPAAARLYRGEDLDVRPLDPGDMVGADWPDELPAILYVDHFGNLISGLVAPDKDDQAVLCLGSRRLPRARTFCEVPPGRAFWYENSFGLIEIAVNQGRADQSLGIGVGDPIGPLAPNPG